MPNSPLSRPTLRSLFLGQPRRLTLRFYTTSIDKYVQAKQLLELHGLSLTYFQSRSEPYAEHYERGTRILLEEAIQEITRSIGRQSLFFVEDTSVRIDALSTRSHDVPGLAVKEWFQATSFGELDRHLPRDPAKRRATVRSDIALHLPGMEGPVFFHGETVGTIASTPPRFRANPHHPWLTPKSFSGWLIPKGATRRLAEMSFDESLHFDFRAQSLTALAARLEEYAAVLNAPRDLYHVVLPPHQAGVQQSLFPSEQRGFVIVGPTCAGKTTFGLEAEGILANGQVIEASNVVRSFRTPEHESMSPFDFARDLLTTEGADVVARRIVQWYPLSSLASFVITGFRTVEELETLRRACPFIQVVLIEASLRTRYSRHLRRAREAPRSIREFESLDIKQGQFGLLRIAADFADIRIVNEGTMSDYREQVRQVLTSRRPVRGLSYHLRPPYALRGHRLYRCLRTLGTAGTSLSCDEIAAAVSLSPVPGDADNAGGSRYLGKPITANNVNKILKAALGLATRIEAVQSNLRYAITPSGQAYLRLMEAYYPDRRNRKLPA